MDQELRAATIEAVKALKGLAADGSLEQNHLYKGLVSLALIFAEGNDLPWVTKLLLEVPVEYYRNVQPGQMLEDPIYAEVCTELARLVILYALVDMGPVINQAPGVA